MRIYIRDNVLLPCTRKYEYIKYVDAIVTISLLVHLNWSLCIGSDGKDLTIMVIRRVKAKALRRTTVMDRQQCLMLSLSPFSFSFFLSFLRPYFVFTFSLYDY